MRALPSHRVRLALTLTLALAATPAAADFAHFEASHVHPIALSADESTVFVVNTPDARLAVFDVDADRELVLRGDVPVGLEPVSVAVRTPSEVWVVNHLSDSVSVVDVASMRLTATIQVGDAPTDVVFANGKAYVTVGGIDDQVQVFDATTHAPVTTIEIFGDSPRALATSNDGTTVYAVVLLSGNQTISLNRNTVALNGGLPSPSPGMDPSLPPPPPSELIVKYNESQDTWEDEIGRDWGFMVQNIALPDYDLFAIDTTSDSVTATAPHAGTSLFDVAVSPTTGAIFVTNTDAHNEVRFEPNLRGRFIDTRVSTTSAALGPWTHHDLNPHIDDSVTPGPAAEIALSVAHPGDMAFSDDGSRLYVTSLGSAKVVVVDAATGAIVERIDVGEGPSGVVLADARERAYVVNRFSNTVSVVDTADGDLVYEIGIAGWARFDPSPQAVRDGRRILYDGPLSSGHGDASCASCHLFGDLDQLAWDLGDPRGTFLDYDDAPWLVVFPFFDLEATGFHPMKGAMMTQTLRSLTEVTPLHWRGDKPDVQSFNPAFVGLLGRDTQIDTADMDLFAAFLDTILMPPNPNRQLDDSLPASLVVNSSAGGGATTTGTPSAGLHIWMNELSDAGVFNCDSCHALPTGTSNLLQGTEVQPQDMLIPQVRNVYLKNSFTVLRTPSSEDPNIGVTEQKNGFGLFHHGATSLLEFMRNFFPGDPTRQHDMAAFLMAFPSDVTPCVGHQVTVTAATKSAPGLVSEITTMLGQADIGNCDVVAKGTVSGNERGYLYDPTPSTMTSDSATDGPVSESVLRLNLAGSDTLTYTGVVSGTGTRTAIDRDRDTIRDFDETLAGSDPADPGSVPLSCAGGPTVIDKAQVKIGKNQLPVGDEKLTIKGSMTLATPVSPAIDPLARGLNLEVRASNGALLFNRRIQPGESPARRQPGWSVNGSGTRWRYKDRNLVAPGGIAKASVRDRGAGVYAFKIGGKKADFRIEATDLPLQLRITLGGLPEDQAGHCATHVFPVDACSLNGSGATAKCK